MRRQSPNKCTTAPRVGLAAAAPLRVLGLERLPHRCSDVWGVKRINQEGTCDSLWQRGDQSSEEASSMETGFPLPPRLLLSLPESRRADGTPHPPAGTALHASHGHHGMRLVLLSSIILWQ